MKNFDEIKNLRSNSDAIYELFNIKIPKWEADKKHYDKTGWGFNYDKRFSACESFSIYFSSWKGTYGDSGCSSQLSLDAKVFGNHLLNYLNENKQAIMLAVAASINNEAKKLKLEAEAEVNKQLEYLKELETL